jgi:hypothetical protein
MSGTGGMRRSGGTAAAWKPVLGNRDLASVGRGVVKDQSSKPQGGSEWESIKILFKNSAYEPDFTRAPSHASLSKSTQPLKCYWT